MRPRARAVDPAMGRYKTVTSKTTATMTTTPTTASERGWWPGLLWGERAALKVMRVDLARRRLDIAEASTEAGVWVMVDTPKTHQRRSWTSLRACSGTTSTESLSVSTRPFPAVLRTSTD